MPRTKEAPLTPERILRTGLNYFHKEAFDEASKYFRKGLSQLSAADQKELREQLGAHLRSAEEEKRWAEASAIAVPLFEVFEQDFELANRIGNFYRKQDLAEPAAQWYQRALEVHPKYQYPRYNLAAMDAGVEAYDDEAKKLLLRFAKRRQFFVPGYLGEKDPIEEIKKNLSTVQKREQVNRLNEKIRKKALSTSIEDIEQAIALCAEADELDAADFEAQDHHILDSLKKRAQSCLFLKPDNPAFRKLEHNLVNLGLFSMKQQEIEAAIEAFEQLKAKESNFHYTELLLALCLARKGLMNEAAEMIKDIAEDRPKDRYLNANLGLIYKELGNKRLATRYLIRASAEVEATEGLFCPVKVGQRARHWITKGEFQRAFDYLQVSLAHLPTPDNWLRFAGVCYDLGRMEMIETAFNEALELTQTAKGPDAKWLQEAIDLAHIKADEMRRDNRLADAAMASEILARLAQEPTLFERAIKSYRNLGNTQKAGALEKEMEDTRQRLMEDAASNRFTGLMKEGKEALAQGDYQKAITAFENALEANPDHQAFGYLVKIYQKLNHKRALNRLLQNWKWIVEKTDVGQELAS